MPSNLTFSGQYGPFLQLTAGNPAPLGGRNVSVNSRGAGAMAMGGRTDQENFSGDVDFGQVDSGDGQPVVGVVGLRVRSNTRFQVVASVLSFDATSLRYRARDVTATDGGSFIKVWCGPVTSTGAMAGLGLAAVGSSLSGGTTLSTLSRGAVVPGSTGLFSGTTASVGGSIVSADNALELPLYLSVPSGFELGPATGASGGSFSFVLQFGIFGGA